MRFRSERDSKNRHVKKKVTQDKKIKRDFLLEINKSRETFYWKQKTFANVWFSVLRTLSCGMGVIDVCAQCSNQIRK